KTTFFWLLTFINGDRDSLIDAQTNSYLTSEGEDITVVCLFSSPGSRRLFCKETCEGENILIETDRDEDKSGRYSIKYKKLDIGSSLLYVTITKLKQSDSGLYRCGIHEELGPDLEEIFEIIVTEGEFVP
uniref:Immunoglobulin domain-containing protein n=1 Tax=Oryzias melastigma TaxID=30732 RepID=A0A3B3DIH8_ORYME